MALGTIAASSFSSGSDNIAIGETAGFNWAGGNNGNIAIGNGGAPADSDTTRIGSGQARAFIAGVRGAATGNADAIPVLVDSAGQLGTTSSSRRYKRDIRSLAGAPESRALARLRPVSFRYTEEHAPGDQSTHYGLIAEEVEEVLPELVVSEDGRPETVAYQELPPLLLAELQRQRSRFDRLKARVARLERGD
jgi:hypothetical protein